MEFNHVPIMLDEVISGLNIQPDGVYVDLTLGGGGHSRAIVDRLSSRGTLIGIDKDDSAITVSRERLKDAKCKTIFVKSDFNNLNNILADIGIEKVDGILADLGVSSYQIDEASRGFSYTKDGPLDMRMDSSSRINAEYIVNNYSEAELTRILFEYGEENFARNIARNIVKNRTTKPITTTMELRDIVEKSYPPKALHAGHQVAKKTFQALRIETNGELDSLKNTLDYMIESLSSGGRLCIITFHSLEDRIVKDIFNHHATDCICPKSFPICVCHHKADVRLVSRKPIIPSISEMEKNSRSKSSKLRIIEKI